MGHADKKMNEQQQHSEAREDDYLFAPLGGIAVRKGDFIS